MAEKLCHKCHKLCHEAKNCPPSKKGKGAAASGARPIEDEMSINSFVSSGVHSLERRLMIKGTKQ
jgi:hypothetical protein